MSNNTFRPLFRGYSKEKKGWVEGAYMAHTEITPNPLGGGPSPIQHLIFKSGFSDWNMPKPIDMFFVEPESVGIWTGLTDKNGNKIWGPVGEKGANNIRILYTDWGSKTDDSIALEEYLKSISNYGTIGYQDGEFGVMLETRYGDIALNSLNCGKHGELEITSNVYQP